MCEGRLNFTNVWFAYYNTHYNAVNMRLKVKNTIIKLLFLIKLFRNQNSKPYFKTARLHFLENILVIFKCFLTVSAIMKHFYAVYRIPVIIVELVVNVLLIETCEYKQA